MSSPTKYSMSEFNNIDFQLDYTLKYIQGEFGDEYKMKDQQKYDKLIKKLQNKKQEYIEILKDHPEFFI